MNLRDYGDGTNQDGKLWERDGLGEEWKSRVSSGHVKFELLSDIPVECQVGDLDMPIWSSEEILGLET